MKNTTPVPRPRFTGVRLLTDNDDAWQAKRHLIANAQRTLDLSYFILEVDGSTLRLMLDLIDAAERGVKVRLLVDYFMTFEQAAALRALAGVGNIEVRRYGLPRPGWLHALQEAGIDRDGFVKGMMSTNAAMLAESLKGNTIFPPATADAVRALNPEPGDNPADFPMRVLSALPSAAEAASAAPAPAIASAAAGFDRMAALRKVALVIEIVRGLKHFLHRTHHKLLLADSKWFVMGGRNLADAYQCEMPPQGRAFQDTDILACDGAAGGSEHRVAFQKLWSSAETADIAQPDPLDTRPPTPLVTFHEKTHPAPALKPGTAFKRGVKLPDMDGALFDNLPSQKGDATITHAYVEHIEALIASGRPGVVDIVSAYLFLADNAADSAALLALRNVFVAAARAGLTVNIYTNSILSTDLKPINQAAYPKLIELIEAGVGIFELDDGQGSLHTKCAAIGDTCLFVGSYNMDPRSELYDTNNLIVLNDASGAATAAFREKRIKGLKWTQLSVAMAWQMTAEAKRAPVARATNNIL